MIDTYIGTHLVEVWDTGRAYTDGRHRIAAIELPDRHVMFVDVDRYITGISLMPITNQYINLKEFVMYVYDYCHYSGGAWRENQTVPFEFLQRLESHLSKLASEFQSERRN